jgi:hypothetical protein
MGLKPHEIELARGFGKSLLETWFAKLLRPHNFVPLNDADHHALHD